MAGSFWGGGGFLSSETSLETNFDQMIVWCRLENPGSATVVVTCDEYLNEIFGRLLIIFMFNNALFIISMLGTVVYLLHTGTL